MKIKVKFSFLLFNALLFMFRDAAMISAFYVACISHELGHIAALKITGGELKSIELSGTGIKMISSPSSSLTGGIFVLLSGAAVNLATYVLLKFFGADGFLSSFSLAEGLFNLLPFSMLDGGAVLDLIAEGSVYERQLNFFYAILRTAVLVFLAVAIVTAKKYSA